MRLYINQSSDNYEHIPIPWWLYRIIRNPKILLRILVFMIIWTLGVCGITTAEVTERLNTEHQAEIEALKQSYASQSPIAPYLAGNTSKTAANMLTAEALARAGKGIEAICHTDNDFRTYFQVFINRSHNKAYPDTVEDCLAQKGQAIGYSKTNPVIEHYYLIALEVLKANEDHWQCSEDFVYADGSTGQMIARNEYTTSCSTKYWVWNNEAVLDTEFSDP